MQYPEADFAGMPPAAAPDRPTPEPHPDPPATPQARSEAVAAMLSRHIERTKQIFRQLREIHGQPEIRQLLSAEARAVWVEVDAVLGYPEALRSAATAAAVRQFEEDRRLR